MRTDLLTTLHIIAWGRPTVRGEIDALAHQQAIYRNLRTCTFESVHGRFPDAASFFAALRVQRRLPAFDAELALSARGADAESFQSSLELVRPPGQPPRFDMKFVSAGLVASLANEPSLAEAISSLRAALDGLVQLGARSDRALGGWETIFASALCAPRGRTPGAQRAALHRDRRRPACRDERDLEPQNTNPR
jgi:hypothetical protein